MEQSLFTIVCTTCQARLDVRNAALVGQIVACPKCQSMVHVEPPPGWTKPGQAAGASPADSSAPPTHATPSAALPAASTPSKTPPPGTITPGRIAADSELRRWTRPAGIAPPPLPKHRPQTPAGPSTSPSSEQAPSTAAGPSASAAIPGAAPPADTPVETDIATAVSSGAPPWRNGLIWGGLAVAGLAVIGAIVLVLSSGRRPSRTTDQPAPASTTVSGKTPPATDPKQSAPSELPAADNLAAAWVPDDARLVVSLTPSKLADRSGMDRMIQAAESYWRPVLGKVLAAFELRHDEVRRVTWSATKLDQLAIRGLVVVEVEPKCDLTRLAGAGTVSATRFRGTACRQLTEGDWKEPFVLARPHTLVTGQADVLAAIGSRTEPRLASRPLAEMLGALAEPAQLSVFVDLAAARQAGWPAAGGPEQAMNVWPAGVQAWRTICRRPDGLGVHVRLGGGAMHSQIDLACADRAASVAVLKAVERLVPMGKAALADKAKALGSQPGLPATAEAYSLLLGEAADALGATRWESLDTSVRLWTEWGGDLSSVGLLAIDAAAEIRSDWHAAAADQVRQQASRLAGGLDDYRRQKDAYPAAAVGGALLPPETRLSWIATLLPYYGHRDWHERLEFGYSWNGTENEPITRQMLPEVVNPAFGPSASKDGFAVTHYVGSAGVGPQANRAAAGDAGAGMFAFGRQTQPGQIRDGASNTIAVLGVTRDFGPWASGGPPTIRALTQRPYVNGPDGFGTGQPDGMFVGMADGSVRFLAQDVDPVIVERLATIAGGEALPAAVPEPEKKPAALAIDRKPAELVATKPAAAPSDQTPPESKPAEPESKTPAAIPPEIASRLNRAIEGVAFEQVELGNLIHVVSEMTPLEIRFDQQSLARAGVSLDAPVTVKQAKTTVGRLLDEALGQCGLGYEVRDGAVVVVAKEGEGTPRTEPRPQPSRDHNRAATITEPRP